MDKSVLLQQKVRDNSEDLRTYLQDLVIWEEEMKRKESDISRDGDEAPEVPIIRNKVKKVEEIKADIKGKGKARINSYDYAAWDKFNVDAECEKVDSENKDEPTSDSEDPSEEHTNRLRDEAIYEKERGNQFVKNKKWDEAIACYTHSIACNSKDPIFYANRALCFLKKNDLHSAEADCTSALQLDPNYVKALQRRAAARVILNQNGDAVEDLKRVLELEPHNNESKKELEKLEKRLGIPKQKTLQNSAIPGKSTENIASTSSLTPIKTTVQKTIVTKEPDKDKTISAVPKQIPWPDRPSSEIIIPIQKLPHQRSRKSLRKIEIYESNSSEISINTTKKNLEEISTKRIEKDIKIDYGESNTLAQILAQSNQLSVDELLKDIEDNAKKPKNKRKSNLTIPTHHKSETKTVEAETKYDSNEVFDFPVPKSSVQFYTNWRIMKNNFEQKFMYLKNIAPMEIPKIFQESLESDIFSDIIHILSEHFIINNLPVYLYLKFLSSVKRFSALTMFMSSKDKIGLKKIIEYCENKSEVPKEEIDILRKKYEL